MPTSIDFAQSSHHGDIHCNATAYTPNKDDIVSPKIHSDAQGKNNEPEIDKSQNIEKTGAKDGPHVAKYKQEQNNNIDKGRGG